MIARMKRSSTLKGDRPPVLWLDRRDATEFVDYDAYYSRLFTEDFSVSTSSLTTRPLEFPDRNSFRILGGGGSEMDRIYRSLGVSGPKDLAISFDAWEACKRSSYNIIDSEKFQAEAAKAADSLGLDNTKLTLAPRTSTRDSFEGWNDFFELLRNRQLPRSLSGCTAVEFLSRLPSDKIEAIVDNLTSANFFAITGDHNENHFGTPIFGKHANGEKNLNPNYQSLPGGYKSETTGRYHDDDKEDLFEICLTTSDVGNLDRLVVTANKDAGKYFRLATILTGTDSLLRLEDGEGKTWLFGFSYPTNISQSYEFTKGWGNYVKEKKLRAGDFVFFQRSRTDGSKLFIGFRRRGSGGAALGDDDAHEFSPSAVLNSTSPATSDKTLELRENLEEVDTPFQLRSPEHRIKGFEPILVISCGDNQDSEEKYFISYIFNELSLRGFTPLRCDLTWSIAIENPEMLYRSRVAIIVFSMNYACSRECLDGFVAIMDHLKANNLLSIPVFFKVSLPDVRGQSGSFEKAFTRLENSVQASQVLKWRAAMIELTSINTYQYMKGDEVMLAKNIVRDVCLLLNSETNKKLQGMRLQLKRILSLLNCSQTSSPQIVGLWGMAGIGKTTITREIFRTQAERYDVCYFLPDFDLMCQTKGLSHLREEFFSKIFGEENSFINACDTKLSFTRDRFLGKSVLIVVDGVSNARDAEVLVGGFGWFSGGHSIILTSRNRQVLVQCKAKEIYEIQKLSEPESLRLCCQFATEQNWKERMSLISELLNYASGNPLVLQVLGLSIQKQCIDDEKQHLRRLRQHPPIKIQDAFRRSFNGLDDNEKNIFLDLACFFRGENKDLVVNILDGCGFLTDLGIYSLIDESLISLVDNRIEMPNIFQDTGRFVVCQEHEEAGKLSRLSDSNDTADVLTNNSGTEAIEGIFLDASGLELEMSATVFERMYRLRLLKLHCPTSENHSKVCLPQGLHSLPDELRLLHWEGYPLGSLPRNFNPINLVELNMPYSNLTKLWKGTKNLEKLKRIILSHSRQLTKFPRLSKARNLEHIDLEGCTSLVKVNSSILHHHKLTFLSLKDCSHLRFMPTTVHLESLEVLNLSGCAELEDFQGFSPNLKELYLAGTAIREMPSSIGDLTKLVTLDLENCNRLQHLPQEISNLKTLVTLCAKRPASSMNLSSVEDTAPAYKRHRLKRVIETVILSLRKRKRGKCVSRATNQVHRGSASTSANDPSSFCGFHVLPERPDQSKCLFYMKTGDCKFGNACKFHHPKDREISLRESSLSPIGLPLRPGKPLCPLYFHNGNCSSGPTCNFDHPSLVLTHKNTSSVASETLHLSTLRVSSTIEDSSRDSSRDSSSEFVEASTKKPRTDKNTSFVASKTLHLSPLRFSSSIGDSSRDSSGDSSSELVEAPTMKPRTHKNPYSVASETLHLSPLRFSSTIGDSSRDSSSEPVEASTKKPKTHKNPSSVASETLHLNPLRFSSLNGDSSRDSSSEPVEASTKKPRTHKNTSSVASKTLHLSRLGLSSSIGDSSSELVKASTVSEVIQATDDGDTTYVANFSEEELDLLGSSLTYPPSSICKPTQSAAQINEVSRARSLEKKLTKEFGDSEFGVCVRSPKTRKSRRSDSEGSVHDAAIRIQSEFRGFKCRKRHLITIQGIVLIQARWRGYQVRKNYRNSVL